MKDLELTMARAETLCLHCGDSQTLADQLKALVYEEELAWKSF